MKRRPQRTKAKTKAASARKAVHQGHAGVSAGKKTIDLQKGSALDKTLSLIRKHPGIRPSELNRKLNREESDGLRVTLIKRGLIRKEKDGSATRYFPV
jgi:hypothetical protein